MITSVMKCIVTALTGDPEFMESAGNVYRGPPTPRPTAPYLVIDALSAGPTAYSTADGGLQTFSVLFTAYARTTEIQGGDVLADEMLTMVLNLLDRKRTELSNGRLLTVEHAGGEPAVEEDELDTDGARVWRARMTMDFMVERDQ